MNNKMIMLIVLIVVTYFVSIFYDQKKDIDESIRYVLNDAGIKGGIKKYKGDNDFTDKSLYWWIIADEPINTELLKNNFGEAYISDLKFFKKVFIEELIIDKSLDRYRLYRGEKKIDDNIICESTCNVAILINFDKKDIFIRISKN